MAIILNLINDNPRLLLALSITVLLLLYRLAANLLHQHRLNHKAKQLHCAPIPTEPTTYPLGLDIILSTIRASRNHSLPDYIVSRFNALNAYTWRTSILFSSNIVTADPKNIQAILATQFNDFGMSRIREQNFRLFLGKSIFTVEGEEWHAAREIIRPIFTRENVSDLALLERHLRLMWECMPAEKGADGGYWTEVVSLNELFPCLTVDSATELFLGKSPESLKARVEGRSVHGGRDFHRAFETIQQGLAMRLRLQGLYWLYSTKELNECTRILNDFTEKAIQEADEREKKGEKKYDYLSILRSRTSNVDEVREHVLGLLAAGRDTTASLLGWTFYCLVRNQRVLEKLRKIVLETFGDGVETLESVSFEKLKGCRYLQFVMNETLRLHSIVPMNSRAAKHNTTLPSGGGPDGTAPVFVPKGTEVRFSTHVMHRRHDIWGPDADELVPERWETARPGWAYAPFNGGPRLCIGQQFALTEAGYVIVRMLQRFDQIEGVDIDHTKDYHNYGMTCGPGPGHDSVKVRLKLARSAV